MKYRAYIIGYRPSWTENNQEFCKRLIEESDLCVNAPDGLAIGLVFRTHTIVPGKKPSPPEQISLRCIGHEYNGKIAILEDFSS